LLIAVFLVVAVATLVVDRDFFGVSFGNHPGSVASDAASVPTWNATLPASADCAVEPSASSESSPESSVKSRPLGKRLAFVVSPAHVQTLVDLSTHHVFTSNWVSSYLPESEFCTILGRFRI
jgi:hypothetical protein